MNEPRTDVPARTDAPAPAESARDAFVRPAVEDLGRLRELTLLGGSL